MKKCLHDLLNSWMNFFYQNKNHGMGNINKNIERNIIKFYGWKERMRKSERERDTRGL